MEKFLAGSTNCFIRVCLEEIFESVSQFFFWVRLSSKKFKQVCQRCILRSQEKIEKRKIEILLFLTVISKCEQKQLNFGRKGVIIALSISRECFWGIYVQEKSNLLCSFGDWAKHSVVSADDIWLGWQIFLLKKNTEEFTSCTKKPLL